MRIFSVCAETSSAVLLNQLELGPDPCRVEANPPPRALPRKRCELDCLFRVAVGQLGPSHEWPRLDGNRR
jgi:hypothetical protein